jgi:hypothetical protein
MERNRESLALVSHLCRALLSFVRNPDNDPPENEKTQPFLREHRKLTGDGTRHTTYTCVAN